MRPLQNVRVVEFATVGGVPFCGWLLAQHGATVIRVSAPHARDLGIPVSEHADIGRWERDERMLDLKSETGRAEALRLIEESDVLIEGFRPGVMDRLGLGPADCHARNRRLVYGRLVGWDRSGPWAQHAGHDINYIAMTGALHAIGADTVPINLVGDLAGGALYLAFGITAALHARGADGPGCVVDTAMTNGTLHLLSAVFGRLAGGYWNDAPASNVIDGGVPWYRSYPTADGRHMAVGAIEERFYLNFLQVLGLDPAAVPRRSDRERWPELAALFGACFRSASMAQWSARFEGRDACVTPVLTLREASTHAATANAFTGNRDVPLPSAVPRFNHP